MKLYSKEDVVDAISQNTFANAILAPLEIFAYKMAPQDSLDTRIFATTLSLAGMSKLYAKGQDFSRKVFGVDLKESSKKKLQSMIHYIVVYTHLHIPHFYIV